MSGDQQTRSLTDQLRHAAFLVSTSNHAGAFESSCEILRIAQQVQTLEAEVSQLRKERDNCRDAALAEQYRNRQLREALSAHETVQMGDGGPGYHIWIPDEENHLESLTCPVLIPAEWLRNLIDHERAQAEARVKELETRMEGRIFFSPEFRKGRYGAGLPLKDMAVAPEWLKMICGAGDTPEEAFATFQKAIDQEEAEKR